MSNLISLSFLFLVSLSLSAFAAESSPPLKSSVEAHVLRLGPGEDPKTVLMNYVSERKILAASIASAVGSLTVTVLRYANQKNTMELKGFREVVSMSGTIGASSGSHLHMSVADGTGLTLGGHLGEGSKVYTTLEIVLLVYPELEFERKLDPKTTFQELSISKRKN
jgi:predicted DNA-binding protein with PD1-like motif